ncbi:MAG TPA: efflux RND transporter periplasmic adaptor subunit, partial [Bdellovibrionales bacterium]|nr:efflux RND transporter periplasmic adaptor subunit [Bdellovibrionales bacterium]
MRFLLGILIFAPLIAAAQHEGHGEASTGQQKTAPPAANKGTPVKRDDERRVPVEIQPEQQQKMGVRIEKVSKKKVDYTIRTVGTVTADQTREAHVHTRINGWIEKIYADFIGKEVKKGEILFELYSPELVSTQEEYLAAAGQPGIGKEIARTALERLRLWGVPEKEIERLKKTRKASRTIGFDAPVNGVVVNKTAIKGMYITPEMELYHIA